MCERQKPTDPKTIDNTADHDTTANKPPRAKGRPRGKRRVLDGDLVTDDHDDFGIISLIEAAIPKTTVRALIIAAFHERRVRINQLVEAAATNQRRLAAIAMTDTVLELMMQGKTVTNIAIESGVSKAAVSQIVRRARARYHKLFPGLSEMNAVAARQVRELDHQRQIRDGGDPFKSIAGEKSLLTRIDRGLEDDTESKPKAAPTDSRKITQTINGEELTLHLDALMGDQWGEETESETETEME